MQDLRPYVCVPSVYGESVRKYLLDSGLLDLEYRIYSSDGKIYFPLKMEIEVAQIRSVFQIDIRMGKREFTKVRDGPRSLTEALNDCLSPEQLALLPRAYDLVGDIAILELPPELMDHRYEIGHAFQQIHPNFSTVLLKRGAISGLTRVREYEVIAGEPKTDTIHTEYGCRIAVDLAKAYFSPRLLEEHHRVASLVSDGEIVLDMFTGVGPFALHIAKSHNAHVFAVDINPEAIALLQRSIRLNRLVGTIDPVTADAHDYVRSNLPHSVDRVIMNHPSGAADFMADACHAVKAGGMIHYYDFIGGPNPERLLRTRVRDLVTSAGYNIAEIRTIRRVRDSAPYEYQMVVDIIIE